VVSETGESQGAGVVVREATRVGPDGVGQGPLRVAPGRRRVSLPWLTLGVLVAAGCALVFVSLLVNVGQRHAVLVVARPVEAGQPIGERDVRAVRVAADPGVAAIPASAKAAVVGRPAAFPLAPGMLLAEAALGEPAGLGGGEALAGVALKPGQYPPGLSAGARVVVLATGAGGSDSQLGGQTSSAEPLVRAATVVGVSDPDTAGGVSVVTLKIPAEAAGRVASAAAVGRISLVRVRAGAP